MHDLLRDAAGLANGEVEVNLVRAIRVRPLPFVAGSGTTASNCVQEAIARVRPAVGVLPVLDPVDPVTVEPDGICLLALALGREHFHFVRELAALGFHVGGRINSTVWLNMLVFFCVHIFHLGVKEQRQMGEGWQDLLSWHVSPMDLKASEQLVEHSSSEVFS